MSVLYRDGNGNVDTASFKGTGSEFTHGLMSISVDTLLEWLRNEQLHDTGAQILAVTVRNGARSKTYYLMPGKPSLRFMFLNAFNTWEYCDFKGTLKTKAAVSRDSASSAGNVIQYDREITKTYEFQTAPLTEEESAGIDQLVASHDVYLIDEDGNEAGILITDSTCEVDNDDERLNAVKLSWRYRDTRPHFSHHQVAWMQTPAGVFSRQFTEEYS